MSLLDEALTYARHGIAVFPCIPGGKRPLTQHGFEDATNDPDQIRSWWGQWPTANIAMPTGTPRWDVLDVDIKPSGSGYPALRQVREAGLADGWSHVVQTPSGGLHLYFAGTKQGNSTLTRHHLDYRSTGGYVLVPPSTVTTPRGGAGVYQTVKANPPGTVRPVSWSAIRAYLEPTLATSTQPATPSSGHAPADVRMPYLIRHVANAPEGNRNAALYWAANRAIDNGAHDLNPLIAAAVGAGLSQREAARTAHSAQRRQAPTSRRDQASPSSPSLTH